MYYCCLSWPYCLLWFILIIILIILYYIKYDSTSCAKDFDDKGRLFIGSVDQMLTSMELKPEKDSDKLFGNTFITGYMDMESHINYDKVKQLVQDYILVHKRFRCRLVNNEWSRNYLIIDEDFSLERHLIRHKEQISHKEYNELISKSMSSPMNVNHPLWEFHVFEKYEDRSIIHMRFHHNLADGMAMLTMGMGMLQPLNKDHKMPKVNMPKRNRRSLLSNIISILKAVINIVLRQMDPPSPIKLKEWLNVESPRVSMSLKEPIEVSRVHRIAKAIGPKITINDVLLSVTSGVMSQLGKEAGVDKLPNGAITLWVNLRGITNLWEIVSSKKVPKVDWGNSIGMFYVNGYWDQHDPLKRIDLHHKEMVEHKKSLGALVSHYVMGFFGSFFPKLCRFAFGIIGHNSTLSMSNLRGPDFELTFADVPIKQLGFYACPIYTLGNFVGFLSYAGKLSMTYTCDARILAKTNQSKTLEDRIEEELKKYEYALFYNG